VTAATGSDVLPPAGWYPDPADAGAERWWSGQGWTDHVQTVAPSQLVAPAQGFVPPIMPTADPTVSLMGSSAYARQSAERAAQIDRALAARKRDPYRGRNVFGGVALVVALVSIVGTIASAFWAMPDVVLYLVTGAPPTVSLLALIASMKLGLSTRMAWLALAISLAMVILALAIAAQRAFL
jgi:hypothetical protein